MVLQLGFLRKWQWCVGRPYISTVLCNQNRFYVPVSWLQGEKGSYQLEYYLYKMFMQNSCSDVQVPVLTSSFLLINQHQEAAFCWSYIHALFTSPQESRALQQIVWLEVMSSTLRTLLWNLSQSLGRVSVTKFTHHCGTAKRGFCLLKLHHL